ncbi:MAG: N-acetyltransferase [Desulfovibrio sp.]|nr:N-acetyltransferase [Desulfovibrio sp.]
MFVHKLADVQSKNIGENTKIWQFCVVLPRAIIGKNCNICAHCFIENDVLIGDNVTVKCGVYLWDGMVIEDNVFIGPNATFCNDRHPVSRAKTWQCEGIRICRGAMIGANSTIMPGVTIGENAVIAAGALVIHNVLPKAVIKGTF